MFAAQGPTLSVWCWYQEQIQFLGATATRMCQMHYWRIIPTPSSGTSYIGILDGEMYLGPKLAAICTGSTGGLEEATVLSGIADANLSKVIQANRGRAPAMSNPGSRP
jgi:hypothetical protein